MGRLDGCVTISYAYQLKSSLYIKLVNPNGTASASWTRSSFFNDITDKSPLSPSDC